MDKMREQFEAWCDVEGINFERQPNGVYASPSARVAWRAWKGSAQVALDEAAKAIEDHDKSGREWIRGSLWDTLSREASGRIRALMGEKS